MHHEPWTKGWKHPSHHHPHWEQTRSHWTYGQGNAKTYADIIRASTTNTKEKTIAEIRARQRQQRDTLRQERAKYEVKLTMKETSDEVKESINTMHPKEITEYVNMQSKMRLYLAWKLQGVNKFVNGVRVRCATEEQANFVLSTGAKPLKESKRMSQTMESSSMGCP